MARECGGGGGGVVWKGSEGFEERWGVCVVCVNSERRVVREWSESGLGVVSGVRSAVGGEGCMCVVCYTHLGRRTILLR